MSTRWTEEDILRIQSRAPKGVEIPAPVVTVKRGALAKCACGAEFRKHSGSHVYCEACSNERHKQRQNKWAKEHPPTKAYLDASGARNRSATLARGAVLNATSDLHGMCDPIPRPPLLWYVRVRYPFMYAASKNHIYSMRTAGHVVLRKESKQWRAGLAMTIANAMRGQPVVNNKVWIELFVQKPNHRGDAVNIIDLVCDAIKDAIPVDDRWYSIRGIDWEISKKDPHLYVAIGQDAHYDAQACSSCGRILWLGCFAKAKDRKNGVNRNCYECCGRKEQNPEPPSVEDCIDGRFREMLDGK